MGRFEIHDYGDCILLVAKVPWYIKVLQVILFPLLWYLDRKEEKL